MTTEAEKALDTLINPYIFLVEKQKIELAKIIRAALQSQNPENRREAVEVTVEELYHGLNGSCGHPEKTCMFFAKLIRDKYPNGLKITDAVK